MDKPVYQLSSSNRIYFSVVAIIYVVLSIVWMVNVTLTPEMISYQIGTMIGTLIGFALFPTLFAFIVWWITGRVKNGGSLIFNLFLTFIVFGHVIKQGKNSQIQKEVVRLEQVKEDYKSELIHADEPDKIVAAQERYKKNYKNVLNGLNALSNGKEKHYFTIMSSFLMEVDSITETWNESLDQVYAERILDISLLTNKEEFEFQKKVINDFINQTQIYKKYVDNMESQFKDKLNVLDKNNRLIKSAIEGFRERMQKEKPIFDPLIAEYLDYANNMNQLINILETNQNLWTYENDELLIDDDDILDQVDFIYNSLAENEDIIYELSIQLTNNM